MSCFNSFIPKVRCHSFRRLSHSKSNSKLTKNPFNNAVLSFAPEVEEATCVGMEVDSEQKNTKKIVQSNLGNIGNDTFMNTLVEQTFVIYRYGASVFLHGEPCLAMLLLGGIVCLRGLLCSYVCIHSLRC